MKIAKFIYPMFLVALGLHGLALFVPMGGASESTPEEVAVEDIEASAAAVGEAVPGPLPVPDLNISTGTAKVADGDTDNIAPTTFLAGRPAVSVATSSSTPRSATGRPVTISRRAPANSPPSNSPSTPEPASSESGANSSDSSGVPLLPPNDLDSDTAKRPIVNNAAVNSTANNTAVNNSATRAIATVSEALKKFRADLSQEITYNPEHTDLEGAADRRDQWLSSLNQQASAATIETLEPTSALGIAKLAYPITESKQPERRSFRLCLDQRPHDAEVGILLDSQGQVARTPEIVRSTGYAALNNEILAAIAAYENFPLNRESKAYTLIVKVEYSQDECVSLPKLMSLVPSL